MPAPFLAQSRVLEAKVVPRLRILGRGLLPVSIREAPGAWMSRASTSTIINLDAVLFPTPNMSQSPGSSTAQHVCRCEERCVLFHSNFGCVEGKHCGFCHRNHEDIEFTRPRKARRRQIRDRLSHYIWTHNPDDLDVHAYLQGEARRQPYARFVIQAILDGMSQQRLQPHRKLFWI